MPLLSLVPLPSLPHPPLCTSQALHASQSNPAEGSQSLGAPSATKLDSCPVVLVVVVVVVVIMVVVVVVAVLAKRMAPPMVVAVANDAPTGLLRG